MTDILRLTVPLTVWLASFSAVYGLHGLVCSPHWPWAEGEGLTAGRIALLVAWIVSVALQVAFLLALRAPRFASDSVFVQRVSLLLAVVALVATVWTLLPVAVTTTCLPPSIPIDTPRL